MPLYQLAIFYKVLLVLHLEVKEADQEYMEQVQVSKVDAVWNELRLTQLNSIHSS
jgi:hypothetical protein